MSDKHRKAFMETLIIFEAGLQEYREYWLQGLSKHFNLILLQPWEPSWEAPYIQSYVKCSFDSWNLELRRLTDLFSKQRIKGIIALNEGTVNFAVDLQKALQVPLTHELLDSSVIRNKLRMRMKLKEDGFLVPVTYKKNDQIKFPVIVKPSEFMSSMGVMLAYHSDELDKSYETARTVDIPEENLRDHYKLSEDVVIEEYIDGEEFSIECWAQDGKILNFSVTKKIKVLPPLFYETGHISSAEIASDLRLEIEKYVAKTVDSFKLRNGLYHFEVMIRDNKVYTVELAARPGGGMIPYLYMLTSGEDYPLILGNIMSGEKQQKLTQPKSSAAVFFPYGENVSFEEVKRISADHSCEVVYEAYDVTKRSLDFSERFGQVVFKGSYKNLLALLENLNKKCMHVV